MDCVENHVELALVQKNNLLEILFYYYIYTFAFFDLLEKINFMFGIISFILCNYFKVLYALIY